jgi:hypothetical protein
MKYGTVGGAGESTDATGAIIVPSGADPTCSGARPVVLYAHGTTIDKSFNMANLRDNQEAALVAAAYAAQGYIVVAPNYAGYDTSYLPYHPYLNAQQSSSDMVDALRAARKAFPVIAPSASGALLIAGYSQGGHVAMATQRAMQLDYGAEFKVTGLASMSGPHAMTLLGDTIFGGVPNLGGTVFIPLIATIWQKSYGNVLTSPTDLYESRYAAGIEALLPSSAPDLVFTQGKLPRLALFAADSAPKAEIIPGTFDAGNLIRTSYRNLYLADLVRNPCNVRPADPLDCTPAFPVRQDLIRNDLRTYVPTVPTLLCGGHDDPTLFFASTLATAAYFKTRGMPPQALGVLNVDSSPDSAADPFTVVKAGFSQAKKPGLFCSGRSRRRSGTSGNRCISRVAAPAVLHRRRAGIFPRPACALVRRPL